MRNILKYLENKSEHNTCHKTTTRVLWLMQRMRTYQMEHREVLLRVVAETLGSRV